MPEERVTEAMCAPCVFGASVSKERVEESEGVCCASVSEERDIDREEYNICKCVYVLCRALIYDLVVPYVYIHIAMVQFRILNL